VIPRKSLLPPIAAVVASAVLHAMVITGATIRLPEPGEMPAVLQAHLAPPPTVAAPAPPPRPATPTKQRPAKHRASPPPRVMAVAPSTSASAPPFVVDASPPGTEEAAAEPQAADTTVEPSPPDVVAIAPPTTLAAPEPPPLPSLPRRGRISYTLFLGTQKFEIGRTVQTWEVDGDTYRIGSSSETTGLAAVLRSERRTYLSVGTVTRSGLRPRSFLMSRSRGRDSEVARARFD
jgi:hypothetical protein